MAEKNLTNRETLRDIFYTALNTYLTSTKKYLAVFFNHAPTAEEIDGRSPFGWIQSAGTETEQPTINQRILTTHSYVIQIGILLGKTSDDDAVEDRLDLVNKAIRDWIYSEDVRVVAGTYDIATVDPTTCGFMEIGGKEYRTEVYPFGVEVKDD